MRAYLVLIVLIIAKMGVAQSIPKLLRLADDLYESKRYLEALEFYEKISTIDSENYFATYRLGNCYELTLQSTKAKEVFYSLGRIPDQEYRARALYQYANLLKLESQFSVADSIFSLLITFPDVEPDLINQARRQKEGCQLALNSNAEERGYQVTLMEEINSKYHDFGAVVNPSNGHLVFATTRNLPGVQYEGSQFSGVLPDLVSYELKRNGKLDYSSGAQRLDRLNTQWAEGSGSFSRDGMTFYFSSCEGKTESDCAIMVSYLEDNKWTRPVKLNEYINEKGSENKQPYISKGGDTLFFTSNRIGGQGGSDIWMSLKGLEKESWTPAINLGEAINTPENEITPYYSSAFACLLYASNGHVGYGGYDLFAAKGESFFEPEIYNLGYPFNSTRDDTYFNVSDSVGFIASNRIDEKILNLYYFDVEDEALFLSLLISGEMLIDAQIVSRFRDIQSLDLSAFRVEDYQGYDLFDPEKRDKPLPAVLILTAGQNVEIPVVASFRPANTSIGGSEGVNELSDRRTAYQITYEKVYFEFGSSSLIPGTVASLKDLSTQLPDGNYQSIDILAYTDVTGPADFNMKLSNSRGMSVKKHLVSLGIPAERIRVLARGELAPTGGKNNWYSRLLSRRVEIVINTDYDLRFNTAKTYIARQDYSSERVAKLLGVSLPVLRQWNNLEGDSVLAGTTLRIFNNGRTPSIRHFLDEQDVRNTFFLYRVQSGETLASIAEKYKTFEELLREVNNLDRDLRAGEQIYVYRLK